MAVSKGLTWWSGFKIRAYPEICTWGRFWRFFNYWRLDHEHSAKSAGYVPMSPRCWKYITTHCILIVIVLGDILYRFPMRTALSGATGSVQEKVKKNVTFWQLGGFLRPSWSYRQTGALGIWVWQCAYSADVLACNIGSTDPFSMFLGAL